MFHVNNLLWIDHKWGDLVKFSSPIFLLDPTNCIFFTLFKSLTIAVYGRWLNRSILKVSSCLFAQYTQQQVSKYQMWPFIYSKASIKRRIKSAVFSSQLKKKNLSNSKKCLLQNWGHILKLHVSKLYLLVYIYS